MLEPHIGSWHRGSGPARSSRCGGWQPHEKPPARLKATGSLDARHSRPSPDGGGAAYQRGAGANVNRSQEQDARVARGGVIPETTKPSAGFYQRPPCSDGHDTTPDRTPTSFVRGSPAASHIVGLRLAKLDPPRALIRTKLPLQ